VKSPPDLTKAVKHAASEKAASRLKENPPSPIRGEREVEIRMSPMIGRFFSMLSRMLPGLGHTPNFLGVVAPLSTVYV
jgi:hypothetical protein